MILTVKCFSVCLCQHGTVCALLNFSALPNVSAHANDVVDGVLHDHGVLLSFERVPLLNVRFVNFWFLYPSLFSQRSTQPSKNCLVIGLATPFLVHLREMVAHHSDLFGNSKLYEWLNDLAAFFSSHLSVLFLCTCQSAKPHLQTTIISLNIDVAAFVIFNDLRCASDFFQLSRFKCF